MIIRNSETLVPQGDTIICAGDVIVLSALSYRDERNIQLREVTVRPDNDWCGKQLKQLRLPGGTLVVLVRRDGDSIIPNGGTVVQDGDILVIITAAGRAEG